MLSSRSFFCIITYGIAWDICATSPIMGFILVLLIGIGVGLYNGIEGTLLNMLIVASVTIILALIGTLLPFLGPIIDTCIILFALGIKLITIKDNALLIVIGIVTYSLLLSMPSKLQEWLVSVINQGYIGWIQFLTGSFIMFVLCYILTKSKYEEKRIATFVLGLPGFCILLFLPGVDINAGS